MVLRHIGFVIFRLHKKVFPEHLERFGEELLSEAIIILYAKIKMYDLDYCDKHGNRKPVKFVSYVWKRIDGFIIDFLKREFRKEKLLSDSALRKLRYADCVTETDEIFTDRF